jgi:predicted MFS family arabinose efflux permease
MVCRGDSLPLKFQGINRFMAGFGGRQRQKSDRHAAAPKNHASTAHQKERLLLWSSNLWALGEGMLGPLFAVFAQRIGGNILDVTWAWAIYLGMTGALTIVAGNVSDRIWQWCGRERLLVAGYALNALCTFGYLLVDTTTKLFIVQAGLGVALALSNPTWSALYARYSPGEQEAGAAWGLVAGAQRLILAAAIVVGGYIVSHYSFNALFIAMGTMQVIATLYLLPILRPSP